jgi:peptide-methionine (S)-S-oxide reductase
VKHPESAYIIYNDVPKVKALKRQFPALWRDEPVLMAASRKS